MFDRFHYWFWKRMARKAIAEGKTFKCAACKDLIIPGDFVGEGIVEKDGKAEKVLVHAGYHYTLSSKDAICTTGAIGTGFWDGQKFVRTQESLASRAMRTGQPQIGN